MHYLLHNIRNLPVLICIYCIYDLYNLYIHEMMFGVWQCLAKNECNPKVCVEMAFQWKEVKVARVKVATLATFWRFVHHKISEAANSCQQPTKEIIFGRSGVSWSDIPRIALQINLGETFGILSLKRFSYITPRFYDSEWVCLKNRAASGYTF